MNTSWAYDPLPVRSLEVKFYYNNSNFRSEDMNIQVQLNNLDSSVITSIYYIE